MSSGERPIGAAKGKQSDTEALCQPPPPPPRTKVKWRMPQERAGSGPVGKLSCMRRESHKIR